jgi:hypothetical protein
MMRPMLFARCITKAADPHSESVINFALWQQNLLRQHASILGDTYNACLDNNITKLYPFFKFSYYHFLSILQEVEINFQNFWHDLVISLLLKYVLCSVGNLQCSLFPSRKSNTYLLFRMILVLWSWKWTGQILSDPEDSAL